MTSNPHTPARAANVFPIMDYAPRYNIEQSRSHVDLYRSLEEEERIYRVYQDVKRDLRVLRLKSFVRAFCFAVAAFSVVYFVGQALRAVLS